MKIRAFVYGREGHHLGRTCTRIAGCTLMVAAACLWMFVSHASAGGLSAKGDQAWHRDIAWIGDSPATGDFFGDSVAAGDFNGDGYKDLAVGVDGEDIGGISDAGAVNVIYGSASGLTAAGNQVWFQDVDGIEDTCEAGDHFGSSVATGDFDGDGSADLAVGLDLGLTQK